MSSLSATKMLLCDGCGKEQRTNKLTGALIPLKRCSRCKMVWYHDHDCQKKHFKQHKKFCLLEQEQQQQKKKKQNQQSLSLKSPSSSSSSSNSSRRVTRQGVTSKANKSGGVKNKNETQRIMVNRYSSNYKCETRVHRGRCMIATESLPIYTRIYDRNTTNSSSNNQTQNQDRRNNETNSSSAFQSIVPSVLLSSERETRCAYCFKSLGQQQQQDRYHVFPFPNRVFKHIFCSQPCLHSGKKARLDQEEFVLQRTITTYRNEMKNKSSGATGVPVLALLLFRIIEQMYSREENEEESSKRMKHQMSELVSIDSINQTSTRTNTNNNNNNNNNGAEGAIERIVYLLLYHSCGVNGSKINSILSSSSPENNNGRTVLQTMISKIVLNCFTITDGEGKSIGLGLYPSAAIVNHSCEPNAVQTFSYNIPGSSPQLFLTTIREVSCGEEVCISYINPLQKMEERRDELWKGYHFKCDCQRCLTIVDVVKTKTDDGMGTNLDLNQFKCVGHNCVNDGEGKEQHSKVLSKWSMYDKLSDGLKCPTRGCNGYGYTSSTFPNEEITCSSSCCETTHTDFMTLQQRRDDSYQLVKNFWDTGGGANDAATVLVPIDKRKNRIHGNINDATSTLLAAYDKLKQSCHIASSYVQSAGDALVYTLLEQQQQQDMNYRNQREQDEILRKAYIVLKELNLGTQYLHISPLDTLQNRYKAAKLGLYLNFDPREDISELQDIMKHYLMYYSQDHEFIDGLKECIQSGFQ